jgi:hypothetical protein
MSVIESLQTYAQGATNTFNVFIDEWWSMDSRDREIRVSIVLPELGTLVDKRFKVFDKTKTKPLLDLVEDSGILGIAVKGCEAAVLDSIHAHKRNLQKMESALEELRAPNDLSESILIRELKDEAAEEIAVYGEDDKDEEVH